MAQAPENKKSPAKQQTIIPVSIYVNADPNNTKPLTFEEGSRTWVIVQEVMKKVIGTRKQWPISKARILEELEAQPRESDEDELIVKALKTQLKGVTVGEPQK